MANCKHIKNYCERYNENNVNCQLCNILCYKIYKEGYLAALDNIIKETNGVSKYEKLEEKGVKDE